ETIHPFSDGNGRVGRILLSYILIGQGLVNVSIKGISKEDREQYYNVLEKADTCFNKIHRLIAKNKKFMPANINKIILDKEFVPFSLMISDLLKEAIDRLEGGQLTNLNKETILPLRDLAKIYDYSQDYLRNLINRGQLKAHKKGKLWYVRAHDLAQHVNSMSKTTSSISSQYD
ncbi:MAG: Fic family protein, partial [Candidatus Omnitrophica bacterium]|nr:Fic family protein [Candidatus Omnitrophota bacterium]